MKTRKKEEDVTTLSRKATSKSPGKKSRGSMNAGSRKGRRSPVGRKSAGWNAERGASDLGSTAEAGDAGIEPLMRSEFYREETGSSDGLYEYVL